MKRQTLCTVGRRARSARYILHSWKSYQLHTGWPVTHVPRSPGDRPCLNDPSSSSQESHRSSFRAEIGQTLSEPNSCGSACAEVFTWGCKTLVALPCPPCQGASSDRQTRPFGWGEDSWILLRLLGLYERRASRLESGAFRRDTHGALLAILRTERSDATFTHVECHVELFGIQSHAARRWYLKHLKSQLKGAQKNQGFLV